MSGNRTTERVDHPPRVRDAIDELMREKDANDNRTTELLREGLTKRGIEWRSGLEGVTIVGDWCFVEYDNGRLAATCEPVLTPEQAIAATLGRPTFDANLEQALSFMRIWISDDAHLGDSELSAAFEKAEGLRKLDAIESAIAATLGGGECEFIIEDNMNESEGMGDVWFRCTNCNATFGYYADGWLMKENFCPNCGRKVKQ